MSGRVAALVDAAAIVGFALVGLATHRHGVTGVGIARDALPLLGGWFGAAMVLRLYTRPTRARLAATWLVGIVSGVLVRAGILGRDIDGGQAAFLATTLVLVGVLVLGVRLVALTLRRTARNAEPTALDRDGSDVGSAM